MRTKVMLLALITVAASLVATSLRHCADDVQAQSRDEHRPGNDPRQGREGWSGGTLHGDAEWHHIEVDAHVHESFRPGNGRAHPYGAERRGWPGDGSAVRPPAPHP